MPTSDPTPDNGQYLSPFALHRFPYPVLKTIFDYLSSSDKPDLVRLMYCSKEMYRRFYPSLYKTLTINQQNCAGTLFRAKYTPLSDDDDGTGHTHLPTKIDLLNSVKHLILEDFDGAVTLAAELGPVGIVVQWGRESTVVPPVLDRVETITFGNEVLLTFGSLFMGRNAKDDRKMKFLIRKLTTYLRPREICTILTWEDEHAYDHLASMQFFHHLATDKWNLTGITIHGHEMEGIFNIAPKVEKVRLIYPDCRVHPQERKILKSAADKADRWCRCQQNLHDSFQNFCGWDLTNQLSQVLNGRCLEFVNLPCLHPDYFTPANVTGAIFRNDEGEEVSEASISERDKISGWVKDNLTVTSKEDADPCVCCGHLWC